VLPPEGKLFLLPDSKSPSSFTEDVFNGAQNGFGLAIPASKIQEIQKNSEIKVNAEKLVAEEMDDKLKETATRLKHAESELEKLKKGKRTPKATELLESENKVLKAHIDVVESKLSSEISKLKEQVSKQGKILSKYIVENDRLKRHQRSIAFGNLYTLYMQQKGFVTGINAATGAHFVTVGDVCAALRSEQKDRMRDPATPEPLSQAVRNFLNQNAIQITLPDLLDIDAKLRKVRSYLAHQLDPKTSAQAIHTQKKDVIRRFGETMWRELFPTRVFDDDVAAHEG